jgi:hypothetical protein
MDSLPYGIFLSLILAGPASLVFRYLHMPLTTAIFALLSIAFGVYLCCLYPSLFSLIGLVSASCGAVALSKL